ncbi:MAG: c-type cytochrome biogenesis protein CcmI, partial [Beijerinckiaceae bacterium]|nr:c-type cytochrome biogenesis protein CcmI [Beijerinckiaceae bacterium]
MFWLVIAVLTAVAVTCVLWPLTRSPRAPTHRDIGAAMYKAQLAEIESDEAQCIVTPEDALGARAEAARRLLTTGAAAQPSPASPRTRTRLASLAVLVFVPALSLVLYAAIGHPELPDAPLAARIPTSTE